MNKILITSVLALLPSVSNAESYAYITQVNPVYQDNYVTRYESVCETVQVPVYRNRTVRDASDGDVLAGAIVGGVIGNQFGGGSGKDALTILGAIAGANKAQNKTRTVREVSGYKLEQQCNDIPRRVNEPTISKYRIHYTFNGYSYMQETTRKYSVGQQVLIQPTLN